MPRGNINGPTADQRRDYPSQKRDQPTAIVIERDAEESETELANKKVKGTILAVDLTKKMPTLEVLGERDEDITLIVVLRESNAKQ